MATASAEAVVQSFVAAAKAHFDSCCRCARFEVAAAPAETCCFVAGLAAVGNYSDAAEADSCPVESGRD